MYGGSCEDLAKELDSKLDGILRAVSPRQRSPLYECAAGHDVNHRPKIAFRREFGVVEQNQVVEWTSVGDDDHRPGRTPSSRCACRSHP
jgi:hypothetical protein